jgi:hypothetical protein
LDLAPDFDEFIASLIAHEVEFLIIGREAFIRNKRASGRLKDLADVEALTPGPDDGDVDSGQ